VTDEILAAGAVVWRPVADGVEVAVVHRPRYDDWSLPKGKLEGDETMPAAAVREVREEAGVRVRLGPWLRDVRYTVTDGRKRVRYWAAQAYPAGAGPGASDSGGPGFVPNEEVDELRWVAPDTAAGLLTHAHDVDVLDRFVELGPPPSVLLLVRHAKAGKRDGWKGPDDLRPLSGAGRTQSRDLAALLPLFGPDRIVSAPLVRCTDTVSPAAQALRLPVDDDPLLREDRFGADPDATLQRVRDLAAAPGVTVLCSQGGVIPHLVGALARTPASPVAVDPDDVSAKKGSVWVLGLRDGALVSADHIERPGTAELTFGKASVG
jgi:8-oxo-dGTP diphosphatase